MFQQGDYLFPAYARKPFQEFIDGCSALQILEQCGDRDARAAKHPGAAHSTWNLFNGVAIFPAIHRHVLDSQTISLTHMPLNITLALLRSQSQYFVPLANWRPNKRQRPRLDVEPRPWSLGRLIWEGTMSSVRALCETRTYADDQAVNVQCSINASTKSIAELGRSTRRY